MVCLKVVLVNLTRKKKLCLKNDVASFDLVLGDNFRYNFDYYVENFQLSIGFKSHFNQFRNVAAGLSGFNFVDTSI
jgi:NTE family protein